MHRRKAKKQMDSIILFIQEHRKMLTVFLLSLVISVCAAIGMSHSFAEGYKKIKISWYPVEKGTLESSKTQVGYEGDDLNEVAKRMGLEKNDKTLWIPKSIDYNGGTYTDINDLQDDFDKYKIIGQAYTTKANGKKSKYKAIWRGNSLVPDTSTDPNGKEAKDGSKTGLLIWKNIEEDPDRYPVAWMAYNMFSVKVVNPFDTSKEIDFFDVGNSTKDMLEYDNVKSLNFGKTTITGIAKKVNNQAGGIAAYLLFCFLLVSLARSALSDDHRLTPLHLILKITKYLVIIRLSFESWKLCNWIMELADSVVVLTKNAIGNVAPKAVDGITIGQSVAVMLANMSAIDKVVSFILVVILWIMVLATATAVLVFVITRVLRILIMIAFAPIPLALLADDKTVSKAKKYLMNLAALGLECAVIVMLSSFYGIMLNNAAPKAQLNEYGIIDMVRYMLVVIVCNAVFATSVQQSSRLSRGIIGGE